MSYKNHNTQIDIFEEVKNHASTVDVAEFEGWKLSKKSNKYWTLCPFHADKSPSLAIYQGGGYKCYACGEAGADGIALRARLDNTSMLEASKRLVYDFRLPIDIESSTSLRSSEAVTNSDFVRGFDVWTNRTYDKLCKMFHSIRNELKNYKLGETNDRFLTLVELLGAIDHWTDEFIYGDEMRLIYLIKELEALGVV